MKVVANDKATLLARAAARVSADPTFMAHTLRQLIDENFNVALIAEKLSTNETAIVKLALCKQPRRNAETFSADVGRISTESGLDAGMIANLLRRADALEIFRNAGSAPVLAAARDSVDTNSPDDSDEP